MTILLLDSHFKINDWIYMDILGVLVKNLLNLISFPLSLPILGRMKIWDFKGIEENDCFLLLISFQCT